MSADEPGHVPPDHQTTAEFRIPERTSPASPAEDTLVDRPLPDDRDPMEDTAVDPVAPATVTDLPVDDPEDVVVAPVRPGAGGPDTGPGEWTEQFGQEEAGLRQDATAPHPGLAAPAGPMAAAAVPPAAPVPSAQPLPPPGSPAVSPEAATPPGGVPAGGVPVGGVPGAFPPPDQAVASPVPGFQGAPPPPVASPPGGQGRRGSK
ncbi:MAG TPA: hypothetical protein VHJ17_00885, partial [Thermomonospora sp.]|nr:hypothetical protein [Thermomonospora sp.]